MPERSTTNFFFCLFCFWTTVVVDQNQIFCLHFLYDCYYAWFNKQQLHVAADGYCCLRTKVIFYPCWFFCSFVICSRLCHIPAFPQKNNAFLIFFFFFFLETNVTWVLGNSEYCIFFPVLVWLYKEQMIIDWRILALLLIVDQTPFSFDNFYFVFLFPLFLHGAGWGYCMKRGRRLYIFMFLYHRKIIWILSTLRSKHVYFDKNDSRPIGAPWSCQNNRIKKKDFVTQRH